MPRLPTYTCLLIGNAPDPYIHPGLPVVGQQFDPMSFLWAESHWASGV